MWDFSSGFHLTVKISLVWGRNKRDAHLAIKGEAAKKCLLRLNIKKKKKLKKTKLNVPYRS